MCYNWNGPERRKNNSTDQLSTNVKQLEMVSEFVLPMEQNQGSFKTESWALLKFRQPLIGKEAWISNKQKVTELCQTTVMRQSFVDICIYRSAAPPLRFAVQTTNTPNPHIKPVIMTTPKTVRWWYTNLERINWHIMSEFNSIELFQNFPPPCLLSVFSNPPSWGLQNGEARSCIWGYSRRPNGSID